MLSHYSFPMTISIIAVSFSPVFFSHFCIFVFILICSFENSNRFSNINDVFCQHLTFDYFRCQKHSNEEEERRKKIKINKARTQIHKQTKYRSIHHFYQFRKQFGCCLVLLLFFFGFSHQITFDFDKKNHQK